MNVFNPLMCGIALAYEMDKIEPQNSIVKAILKDSETCISIILLLQEICVWADLLSANNYVWILNWGSILALLEHREWKVGKKEPTIKGVKSIDVHHKLLKIISINIVFIFSSYTAFNNDCFFFSFQRKENKSISTSMYFVMICDHYSNYNGLVTMTNYKPGLMYLKSHLGRGSFKNWF